MVRKARRTLAGIASGPSPPPACPALVRDPVRPPPEATTARVGCCNRDLRPGWASLDDPHPPSNGLCPMLWQIGQGHGSIASLSARPSGQETDRPLHRLFRGLLDLHSRSGPLDRTTAPSPAPGSLCSAASTRPVVLPGRSSASGSIDNASDEPSSLYLPG